MDGKHTDTRMFLGMPAIICSEPMRELMRLVERVAMTNATVLITGDTGSGKELVARALHHHSLRHSKPWVDVNCAALPEHLIESELFGYEKGAFSGAESSKQGLFELAHGGTLFLDEIGELDCKMQVKLLRVLDGTPYYRLGASRKTWVDVRVLAATNQDLEEATQRGAFRQDLYHRLGQIQIRVPALRERVEDIVPIAEFLLSQHNPNVALTRDAKEALRTHSWPGNVRELRNVVSKAALLAEGDEIKASDLPLGNQVRAEAGGSFPICTLDGMERQMIFRVLEQTGGHQQRAAELLGISRRTLSRKLKLYGTEESYQHCVA